MSKSANSPSQNSGDNHKPNTNQTTGSQKTWNDSTPPQPPLENLIADQQDATMLETGKPEEEIEDIMAKESLQE